jgi:hypothetical protein
MAGATTVKGPYSDGVPGSGYGCDNPCNGGDVNYVMEAKLQSYTIKGSKNLGLGKSGNDVKMFTRTFEGIASQSSPFCMNGKFVWKTDIVVNNNLVFLFNSSNDIYVLYYLPQ